ncbi:MAG: PEGA domain-containing protein, partial [Gluconacetobacter diazotrophicus]|nr:PEGA domain-containing protein [Gluconacetobacter diazotrophicus]
MSGDRRDGGRAGGGLRQDALNAMAAANGGGGAGGCSACGRTLFGAVAFCPFCGREQGVRATPPAMPATPAVEDPDPEAGRIATNPAVAPAPAAAPPGAKPASGPDRSGTPPPPPVRPATASGAVPEVPPPRPPAPPPAGVITGRWGSVPPVRKEPARPEPTGGGKARTERVPPPGRRPRRRGALLRLAVVALLCWVLWRLLGSMAEHGTGTVSVFVPRGVDGTVLVDGTPRGRPGEAIRLGSGRHEIGLDAAGWDARPRTVTLRDGEAARVSLQARAVPDAAKPADAGPEAEGVAVAVDAVPSAAALAVDGRPAGGTPTTLSLRPGTHRLRVTAQGYTPEERVLAVRPGDGQRVRFALRREDAGRTTIEAPVGDWSASVALPSGTRFGLVF